MKNLLILFILLPLTAFSQNIPNFIGKTEVNSIFFDIGSEGAIHIPSKDNSRIFIYDSELIDTVTLFFNLKPKLNYFKKISSGYMIYNDYTLYIFDSFGKLVVENKFPIGCIPEFIYSDENYIYLSLPKRFDKDVRTIILDVNTLDTIGRLGKKDQFPMILINDSVIPINLKYVDSKIDAYFLGNIENQLYWIDRNSNRLYETAGTDIIKTYELDIIYNSGEFKNYIITDGELYYLINQSESMMVKSLSLE